MLKTQANNKLTSHPSFAKIMSAYNAQLSEKGKVSGLKFYRDVILPEIPDYSLDSWYFFLKKFKTAVGIVPIQIGGGKPSQATVASEAIGELQKTLLSNSEATMTAISLALNISTERLKEIAANPTLMSSKDAAELFLKVMKAQDSRVKAIGGMRADNREQERFERMQSSAAYG